MNYREAICDLLEEAGLPLEKADEVAGVLYEIARAQSAQMVREWLDNDEGWTPAAVAVRRVLRQPRESRRQAAKRIGCSDVAILKAEQRIRRKLAAAL